MFKIKTFFAGLLILMFSSGLIFSQYSEQSLLSDIKINSGIGLDYFSRTVRAEGEDTTNRIKCFFLTLNTEFEINDGLSITAILGYSISNFNSMTFRQIPISLELDVGSIGGLLGGLNLDMNVLRLRNFEMDISGRIYYSIGLKQTWDIPGLSVDGTAEGKPSLLTVQVGPVFTYTGFAYFFPYVNFSYNKLWGKFKMDETIQDLTGSEEKILTSRSDLSLSAGFIYELSKKITAKAEGILMPHSDFKNSDFGLMFRLIYAFN
jgi:hypothetical protein